MKKIKKYFRAAIVFFSLGITGQAYAVPITPTFNDYPGYLPTQDDLDTAASSWFNSNYGLTFDHLYMYTDSRDKFDGIGIANGWLSDSRSSVTGTINFTDSTNYLDMDYVLFSPNSATYSVYDSTGGLLESISSTTMGNHSYTFTHDNIAKLTISGLGSFAGISTLSYDYDGTTDGSNDDTSTVPEPSILALMGLGIFGLSLSSRRKIKK